MPETYEQYLKRFKKAHGGSATGAATRQTFESYHGIQQTAQRAGMKPGPITRAAQQRGQTFNLIKLLGRKR